MIKSRFDTTKTQSCRSYRVSARLEICPTDHAKALRWAVYKAGLVA